MKLKDCVIGNQGQQFGFDEINESEDDAAPQTPTQPMSPLIDTNNSIDVLQKKKRPASQKLNGRVTKKNKTVFGLVEEQGASLAIFNSAVLDQLKLHNKYLCDLVVELRRFNNQGRRDSPIASSPIKDMSPITSSPIKDMSVLDMTIEALDSESSITSSGIFYTN